MGCVLPHAFTQILTCKYTQRSPQLLHWGVSVQGMAGGRGELWGNWSQRARAANPGPWSRAYPSISLCAPLSSFLIAVSIWVTLPLPRLSSFCLSMCLCVWFPPGVSLSTSPPSPAPVLGLSCPAFSPARPLLPAPVLSSSPSSLPGLLSAQHPRPCLPLPRVSLCTQLPSLSTSSLSQASIEKEGVTLVAILCTHKHW